MKFTKDHEWVKIEGDIATIGITKFAADAIGELVYVELFSFCRDLDSIGCGLWNNYWIDFLHFFSFVICFSSDQSADILILYCALLIQLVPEVS